MAKFPNHRKSPPHAPLPTFHLPPALLALGDKHLKAHRLLTLFQTHLMHIFQADPQTVVRIKLAAIPLHQIPPHARGLA